MASRFQELGEPLLHGRTGDVGETQPHTDSVFRRERCECSAVRLPIIKSENRNGPQPAIRDFGGISPEFGRIPGQVITPESAGIVEEWPSSPVVEDILS